MSVRNDFSSLDNDMSIAEIQLKLGVGYAEAKRIRTELSEREQSVRAPYIESLTEAALDYELVALGSFINSSHKKLLRDVMLGNEIDTSRSAEYDTLSDLGVLTESVSGKVRLLWDEARIGALIDKAPEATVVECARLCMDLCMKTLACEVIGLVQALGKVTIIPMEFITLIRIYRDYLDEKTARGVISCSISYDSGDIHMLLLSSLIKRQGGFDKERVLGGLMADIGILTEMLIDESELCRRAVELTHYVSTHTAGQTLARLAEYEKRIR